LRDLALQRLRDFRKATGGAIPLVGVGGIATAEDAWERIRAGLQPGPALHGDGL
jgi:dihydroorotate dehydrogenase